MKRFGKFLKNFFVLFVIISVGWVIFYRFVPVFFTPLMLIRSVEAISDGEAPKINKKWVSIEKISPNMIQAVAAAEDDQFMEHHGFSFEAIHKAIQHNKRSRRIRGGSTISQQTAKNVFLWPHRSYLRKGLEAYFTVLIELFWTKERIMEVYLNVIETGDGIYGVEAASLEYFGKHASKLTKPEAALIAACLPNPRRFNPAHPSPYILRRQAAIMRMMEKISPVEFHKTSVFKKTKHKHR
ncbi:MAG TPA: monofunctional biosynthetic peptidoglycan transglycosylase [Paludibacteraceae bacterium]|nr:monofunctional biosynthetic peptidoglycan transglycosylase [Paludibacteraceae bacterium]HPC27036.1 monofunctional biosynthetic peptidoglycan transglycosylase [Paludibacteraceae bacterium]HPO66836.1 monofunctional biosynthetic peptidoglycan transglycosylase [Paludibacteraceae bacterium]